MTKQDYLFKTIEFTKVDEVTPYAVTTITPVFSGDIYAKYPNENFTYSSLDEMKTHLKELFNYTDAKINEYITTLQIHTTRTYYKPLYTIKWYIGGLYDYMHTIQYTSTTVENRDSLVHPEIDDSKIKDGQNEVLGYAFPERLMKLIRNKPINRMRMYVNAAPTNTYYKSDVNFFDNFQWVNTSQFNPTASGATVGIKIPGEKYYTYMWVVYGATTNDTQLTSAFDPTLHRYIGVSCNNISDTAKTLPSDNADPNNRWPEYSWQQISLSDPATSLDDPDTPSYIYLGTYNYQLHIRYTEDKKKGPISKYSIDNYGKQYKFIGFQIIVPNDGKTHDIDDIDDIKKYDWHTLSVLKNVQRYDINGKRYFLYIRFTDDKGNVYNSATGTSNNITNIIVSFFNSSDIIENNYIFNNTSSYEGVIPFNAYANYRYLEGEEYKYVWVKFADNKEANSDAIYDYGIYTQNNNAYMRQYLYLALSKTTQSATTNKTDYYKLYIGNLLSDSYISPVCYDVNGDECDMYIHIKFATKIPQILAEASNYFDINTTKFIGISITDKNGQYHKEKGNSSTTLEEYIWVPARNIEIPTDFHKERYVYFTYANDLNDPDNRSQCPTYINDANTVVNKKLFGYAYDLTVSISNKHKLVNEVDKTSREITLYRADSLNALTEAHIHKITTINIPYTTMGKYSVFNFDPVVINDNEYLIIGGNRDNTCPLVCVNDLDFTSGQHPDYALENLHLDTKYNELRPQVTGSEVMYYTNANFLTLDNWTPETRKYLPIDIGCGFASASNEVQVTTKSFKEILAETQTNDEVALQQYKDEHSDKYTAPNYNLYVNLTYKFAKIIDGNIDYMPLYNRYKIKYKFKNENQQILQQKVFDTSVITPDGSIYDKPTQIIIDDVTYTKTSQKYLDYFDYIEGDFTQTIKETDKEVTDRDYDVAYFQCNNILEDLYQSNNSQQFNADYYNYKFLADDSHKEYLPVLCEVTISAYETNTALYTRAIPVTLAAYSLVEITDDYIRTTVSKIENDYIYGLTQRTSRIEQYADRISMSVQNITQGLYSRMQMTEDKILMEVVDASKNIGAAFNMTANKIQSLVYDTSAHMYSQILLEKNKISLEVANDFRKAGIYLTEDSAEIDAPKIKLHGERTTIEGALQIYQQTNSIDGFIMYNKDKDDKIHITIEEIPKFEDLSGVAKSQILYFAENLGNLSIPIDNNYTEVADRLDPKAVWFNTLTLQFFAASKNVLLTPITYSGKIEDPYTNELYDINEILSIPEYAWTLYFYTKEVITGNSSSRNLLASDSEDDTDMLYGEGETSTPTIAWQCDGVAVDPNSSIKQYIGVSGENLPYLQLTDNINGDNVIITSSDANEQPDQKIISNMNSTYREGNHRVYIQPSYVENNITYTPVTVTITAAMSATIDGTTYTDTQSFLLEIVRPSHIHWEYNGTVVTEGTCYIDSLSKSILPHLVITGSEITLSDITFTAQAVNGNNETVLSPSGLQGITVDNTGAIQTVGSSISETNVTIYAKYTGTYAVTASCLIKKEYYYNFIEIPQETVDEDFNPATVQQLHKEYYYYNGKSSQYYTFQPKSTSSFRPLSAPQDIKLELVHSNTSNMLTWRFLNITYGMENFTGFFTETNQNFLAEAFNENYVLSNDEASICHRATVVGGPEQYDIYKIVLREEVWDDKDGIYENMVDLTNIEPPKKGSCTARIPAQLLISNEFTYNAVDIILDIDTFNDLNCLYFFPTWDVSEIFWDNQRRTSTYNLLYKRKQTQDPIEYINGNYQFINNFEYESEFTTRDISISIINPSWDPGAFVKISFILLNDVTTKNNLYFRPSIFFDVCCSDDHYDSLPIIEVKNVSLYKVHPLYWRIKNIGNKSSLNIQNLTIYTEVIYQITAGTRIGNNGMYSYIDQKSLFYFDSSIIALRQGNNGFRFMQEKNGITYEGSSGIEIYVGSNTSWAKNQWFSMFNYTPLLRFYMEVTGSTTTEYKYPDWAYTWYPEYKQWRNPGSALHFTYFPSSANWYWSELRNGWGYGRIYSLGLNDTDAHYFWCYDPSYHKGMLSMEQFSGASDWNEVVSHPKHFILLPTDFYDDDHKRISLPPGYTVTIINSQFRKTNRYTSTKGYNPETWEYGEREEKGEYGWPRMPIIVSLYKREWQLPLAGYSGEYWDDDTDRMDSGFTNYNFIKFVHQYRQKRDGKWGPWTDYTNTQVSKIAYNQDAKPGNFIDAHGDPCCAIWLTKSNGDYPDNHFMVATHATFIWNGFVWHSSCDGDGGGDNYQIENSDDNRD